ncbi:MAG: DUF1565 domain-containing protein [Prevotellaceae bacterium]|jgi:hypothetical protein|nr:DUF1565 domain-containing protein [Prevotellaceae bacterium]
MRKQIGLLAILTFLSVGMLVAKPVYVSTGGSDANEGISWQDAYASISAALGASSAGDEVFVAKGTYNVGSGITLKEGVNIYGGFAGTEESITGRGYIDADNNGLIEVWEMENVTMLVGDGTGSVIKQVATFSTATIVDGLLLRGGSDANGGGASLKAGTTMQGCIVQGNSASNGGGVYLDGGTLQNSLVTENIYSAKGGGVYATGSGNVKACRVVNNTLYTDVKVGDALGGGVVFYVDAASGKAWVVSAGEASKVWGSDATQWGEEYAGGGYTDWALPTNQQLQKLYAEKKIVNATLANGGNTTMSSKGYWSSEEENSVTALATFFDTGYTGGVVKENVLGVRAVREVSY